MLKSPASDLLAALVDSSDDAIISKTLDGVITSWNRAAGRIFGYTAAEAIGRPVTMLFPSERIEEEAYFLDQIARGDRVDHFETERIRKDGTRVEVSVTLSPIRDGQGTIIGVSSIARDISSLVRLERHAAKMTADLDRILAATDEGIVALDRGLRYIFVNDAAVSLVGIPREDVIGRTPFELFPPQVLDQTMPHIRHALDAGCVVRYEAYNPAVNRWYENRLYPTPEGLSIFFTDVSARKQVEQVLKAREESQRLLVLLNDVTRNLADPDDILSQFMALVGRHFQVGRCTYGEIDSAQQHVIVARDYTDGVISIAGRHRLNDFGATLIENLRAGRTVLVPDVRADPRTSDPVSLSSFAAIQTRALLCVPLVKDQRFVALFVLHHPEPREWSRDDKALMEQVAERTWFAVENARAAAALRESRDVLSLAMRGGRMGAWARNVLTNEVWWSRELEELFGLPPGGFSGTEAGFLAFVHDADRPHVEEAVRTAVANHTDYFVQFRFRHSTGVWRWMEGRGRAVYGSDGTPLSLYGLGIDISERKAFEDALRLLVRIDDAVRPLDNPEDITFTAARVLGEHLDVHRCAYASVEDDADTFVVTGNYTNGTTSIVGRYRFRQFGAECLRLMRAGEPFVVEDSASDTRLEEGDRLAYERTGIRAVICVPIHRGGRFVAAMAVHTTGARRWRADEIQLVQQVASRCGESIERARAERERAALLEAAQGANRAKDEFLAMLGHELRNPLAPILTAIQLMKLRGERESVRERTVIERQVTHLTRLVDDLLDVSRIARGKVELKFEVLELADIVTRAIEVASPLLEQRAQTLTVTVPTEGLPLEVDAARLTQVFSNLLTNAAKYTRPGGDVSVLGAREGDEVVVRVRDNGMGITSDVLPRVFDLFVQGPQSLDRAQGGLGLGLTIVRSLVERHHGTVSASSRGPDRGSEFVVRLPVAHRRPVAAPAASGAVAPTLPRVSRRVLIVDDNDDAALMLQEVLRARGYDTRVAHDGPHAIEVAAAFRPDAALLDIGLPVMDGYELAARLKDMPEGRDIRLVAVTGYGQPADRHRTAAAGFDHHLVKPVSFDALEQLLAALPDRGDDPPR